jgi:hypothetical protein
MVGLILGFVFLIIGVVLLILGVVAAKRAKAAQSWPVIPGTVVNSTVVEHASTDSEGDTSVTYEPLVEYRYNVMGQVYTAKRVAFGANRFNYNKAAEIAARYPAGAQVNVHYNPDKVKDATLETSVSGGKLFIIIGAVMGAVGLVIFIVSLFML